MSSLSEQFCGRTGICIDWETFNNVKFLSTRDKLKSKQEIVRYVDKLMAYQVVGLGLPLNVNIDAPC